MPRKPRPHPYRVTIVRYQDADGRRCRASDPGAQKVTTRSETYYADLPGAPRTALGTADEGEAWEVLRRKLREQEEASLGLLQPHLAAARAPIADQVAAWIQTVRDKGRGAEHCDLLRSRVLALTELAGWSRITDISEESCLRALARLQQEKGASAQTRNHYRTHIRQFCGWLDRTDRLRRNPLLEVGCVNVDSDRRHIHRDPSDEDVGKLWAYLLGGAAAIRCGMTGPQRALAYSVAMATGYRANELGSLTWAHFDLADAAVTVEAGYSKRRRRDRQPLPPWLVADLLAWREQTGAPEGACWPFPPHWPGRLLKADVQAAGVPYRLLSPEGPHVFDMHSLRVWYISRLATQPGISPAVLFRLARHSDPKLTLKIYAKVQEQQQRSPAADLPKPAPTAPQVQTPAPPPVQPPE